ncbi:MAG: TIGR02206 family membrane protein [Sandaracinaceae bacterium]|nr:TIGR02206 family membrane protein [Sandaracinaceae bacterium]
MPPEPFTPFGLTHLATVAVVLSVIGLAAWSGRRAGLARAKSGGRALGALLLVYYGVESWVRIAYLGVIPAHVLPFEICNALFFIGAFALLTDHRVAHEIVFFWTFAATVHALITPTPLEGWPSVEYVRYFAAHGLLVLVAVYAVVALDKTVTWWSFLRAAIALQVWEGIVALVNLALDQNFMYLRRPPPSPTLIDALGPWPYYLLSLELIGLASFALWLGIHHAVRRVLPVRPAEPPEAPTGALEPARAPR